MSTPELSKDFPKFKGSLAIESSDGVIFHASPFLLRHISGYFERLLSETKGQGDEAELVKFEEDSETLTDFLLIVDPGKPNPPMRQETLASLLKATHRYEVPSISIWFESTVALRLPDKSGNPGESFIQKQPLLALKLSHEQGLEQPTRLALRELSICPHWMLLECIKIDHLLYREARLAREVRIKLFDKLVTSLAAHNKTNSGVIKDVEERTCTYCTVLRGQWFRKLSLTASKNPNWKMLEPILAHLPICEEPYGACPSTKWVGKMKGTIEKQREALQTVELPNLPEWLQQELKANMKSASGKRV